MKMQPVDSDQPFIIKEMTMKINSKRGGRRKDYLRKYSIVNNDKPLIKVDTQKLLNRENSNRVLELISSKKQIGIEPPNKNQHGSYSYNKDLNIQRSQNQYSTLHGSEYESSGGFSSNKNVNSHTSKKMRFEFPKRKRQINSKVTSSVSSLPRQAGNDQSIVNVGLDEKKRKSLCDQIFESEQQSSITQIRKQDGERSSPNTTPFDRSERNTSEHKVIKGNRYQHDSHKGAGSPLRTGHYRIRTPRRIEEAYSKQHQDPATNRPFSPFSDTRSINDDNLKSEYFANSRNMLYMRDQVNANYNTN